MDRGWARRVPRLVLFHRCAAIELHLRARLFLRVPIASYLAARCRPAAKSWGRQLAREAPVEADLVVPVPDSGVNRRRGLCGGEWNSRFASD